LVTSLTGFGGTGLTGFGGTSLTDLGTGLTGLCLVLALVQVEFAYF
jgi:hypothetical protein